MREVGGCLLAIVGLLGFFLAITLSFTFYLLPLAFILFLGSLILISSGIGPGGQGSREEETSRKKKEEERSSEEND